MVLKPLLLTALRPCAASGAPPHSPPGGGVAICLGGGSDVPPKQRGEVTVVGVADPSADLVEGQRVLQMRLNIGGRALQLGQGEPAVERRIEVPAEGVHDVLCSCGPLPLTPNDIVDNGSTA